MRRLVIVVLSLSLFVIAACKKKEEQQQADAGKPGVAKSDQTFRPQGKKNRKPPVAPQQLPPASLKIFNGSNLVTDIQPTQYPSLATSKIKIGPKQHNAILLKDLLAKYNVKGKSVILAGDEVSTPLTWEQANGKDVYMYITPKKFLKVFSASLANKKFPKRIEKITVEAT